MPEITIQYQPGRLTAVSSAGKIMGYVTFPQIRKGLVNIDRVQIVPEYRLADVETILLDALLSHLQQQGMKAALTSPAAQRHVANNPLWKSVLPDSMHMTAH